MFLPMDFLCLQVILGHGKILLFQKSLSGVARPAIRIKALFLTCSLMQEHGKPN